MYKKILPFLIIAALLVVIFNACNEVNGPGPDRSLDQQDGSFETIDSDLSLLKEGGMRFEDADGIFSIGWNEIFRPFDDESQIVGMAFAVAFGEQTDFSKFGIDMGSVFINYADHQVKLHKRGNDRRGVMYSLFKRPFGNSDRLLDYIPGTDYQFEVTGSDKFSPISFALTSPDALMDVTSHSHGDIIDPAQDLTVTWDGGTQDGKVAVRLMAHIRGDKGPRGKGPKGPRHPHPDHIIFEILETNTGEYTFTSAQIQELLRGTDGAHLVFGVSQMDFGEVEHDGGVLRTAMRNGNCVKLKVQ
jgi:hypothetical protein